MPDNYLLRSAIAIGLAALTSPAMAGGGAGIPGTGATEFTQIMNNAELISLGGQSAQQIVNQVSQITNQVTQIQNQLRQYENMLQNTMQLPNHIWGQVAKDIQSLQSAVQKGQAIAYSMGNLDNALKQRFASYTDFQANLPNATNYSETYKTWTTTNRDTISGTLAAAGLTSSQFSTEESTMSQLRSQSQSADGQMKALQVGHQIAAQQVEQMQKLRGMVSQQAVMMGTWYQSEQAKKDATQVAKEDFFKDMAPATTGGQKMEPKW